MYMLKIKCQADVFDLSLHHEANLYHICNVIANS